MSSAARPRPDCLAGPSTLPTVADSALPALSGAATYAIGLDHVWVQATSRPPRLRDITLAVRPGEHWGILGANGSGKSTLLDVVRGRLRPSRGTVRVLGQEHGAVGFLDPGLRIGVVEGAPPPALLTASPLSPSSCCAAPVQRRYGERGSAMRRSHTPAPCSTSWVAASSQTGCTSSARRDNASESTWREPSCASRSFCCWTSRRPRSICRAARPSSKPWREWLSSVRT
jgi:energy-coupling factor transporter ATP-binding protein EcfA2